MAKLLIDVGNTNLKYTWLDETIDSLHDLVIEVTQRENFPNLLINATECIFCSVADSLYSERIFQQCKQANVAVQQVHTQAKQLGISNAYTHIQNMGADRWMAILAGRYVSESDFVVIDAGTAITCDFVIEQKHAGGWIAPGFELARRSVVNNTARVFGDLGIPSSLSLGTDTPDCLANGIFAQLIGVVIQAKNVMQHHSSKFELIISGGNGAELFDEMVKLFPQNIAPSDKQDSSKISQQWSFKKIENLVLLGMAYSIKPQIV